MSALISTAEKAQDNDIILNVKIVKSQAFKVLMESLKMLSEALFVFDERGISMISIDSLGMAYAKLFVEASSFELYHCTHKIGVGLEIHQFLATAMKSIRAQDHLQLFMRRDDESHQIHVVNTNDKRNTSTTWTLPLIQIKEIKEIVSAEMTGTTLTPLLPSSDLLRILREVSTIETQLVNITLTGNTLTLSAKDDNQGKLRYTNNITLKNPDGTTPPANNSVMMQSSAYLKYMLEFSKASQTAEYVRLRVQTNEPLIMTYDLANFNGRLSFVLLSHDEAPQEAMNQTFT